MSLLYLMLGGDRPDSTDTVRELKEQLV